MLQPKPEARPTFSTLVDRLERIPKARKQTLTETVIAPRKAGEEPSQPIVSIYADPQHNNNYDNYDGADIGAIHNIDFTSPTGLDFHFPLMNEPMKETSTYTKYITQKKSQSSRSRKSTPMGASTLDRRRDQTSTEWASSSTRMGLTMTGSGRRTRCPVRG
jgi:hypothetical protein